MQIQIIGGGLIGLSTAYALLKRGAKNVRVVDTREGVGLETSFANAGMVHASLANPWNGPGVGGQLVRSMYEKNPVMKLRLSTLPSLMGWGTKFLQNSSAKPYWHATRHNYALAAYSINLNRQWRQDLSISDNYDDDGLMKIVRTQQELCDAKETAERLQDYGLKTEFLTKDQACEAEPALLAISDRFTGAIYYPTDFKADAYKFCKALETEIRKLGGEVILRTDVQSFVKQANRVEGVHTSSGQLLADVTIICAGAQSRELLKTAKIDLKLRPVKGYSLSFDRDLMSNTGIYPKIPVVDDSLHTAITPFKDFIRIAGTAELAGYNASRSASSLAPLLNMLKQVYPQISENLSLKDAQSWHGFRPVSADGLPFIGQTKLAGLAVNTGHAHMGWTMCAGSAALLADMVLGEKPALSMDVFNPKR